MLYFPILYVLLFNILYICVTYIALNDLIVKYFYLKTAILANFDKRQLSIILHLLNNIGQDSLILTTQKHLLKNLNVSISIINKTIKELNQLKIIEKVKNGKYLLLRSISIFSFFIN